MAENSPVKQARAFHPYGRIKSPLRPSQQILPPPTTTTSFSSITSKMSTNYFSFSGGSSSLFPKTSTTTSTNAIRTAMSEISSMDNGNAQKPRPFSIINSTLGLFGAGGAKPSTSIYNISKADPAGVPKQTENKGTTVGAIGSRRPFAPITSGKPLRGTGFIPVQRSFKIWGDTDSNSNSMEFADEVVQPKEEEKKTSTVVVKTEEIHRSKSVRKNLFQQAADLEVEQARQPARGILTERKHALYDYPEYIEDIYNYFLDYERRTPIKAHYMSRQQDITHGMRCILVDWLVEVGLEYGFEEGTIFMAVGYVDRFLGKMAVARNKLQLVGTTAMYIAAKCQEVDAPGITDVVHITDETYTKDQILIMEGIMLRTIQFDLLMPTTYDFLRCLGSRLSLNSQAISISMYLAELSMVDGERFLRYKPSVIATACVALTRYTLEDIFWDTRLEKLSRVKHSEIRPVCSALLIVFYDAPTKELTAVYDKYKSVRYNCVSFSLLKATLPPLESSTKPSTPVFSI